MNTISKENVDADGNRERKNELEVAKVYLPILYVIFRLQYGMNKYYLMFHVFMINMYVQYRNKINNL